MELYLASILYRMKQLIVAAVIRMTRRGDDALINLLNTCQTARTSLQINSYGKKVFKTLFEYGAVQ